MDEIEFVQLSQIAESDIIALMNNAEVGKQMPLLAGGFSADACKAFLAAKAAIWAEYGYGPWAFVINGRFAGWGGLQPEHGEPDFALVLHPDFWGLGRKIFTRVAEKAFGEMGLETITILFPPTRQNWKAITRVGFKEVDRVMVDGEAFVRFRLKNPRLKETGTHLASA